MKKTKKHSFITFLFLPLITFLGDLAGGKLGSNVTTLAPFWPYFGLDSLAPDLYINLKFGK